MIKLRLTILLIVSFLVSTGLGQNNIKNVNVYSDNNALIIHPILRDFFNDDILGSVNSGMNITFHFYSEIHDSKKKLVKDQENQIHVRNDIWENQYTISGYQFFKRFAEFEKFKNFMLDSLQFKIDLATKVKAETQLQLFLTFSPHISKSQKSKIRDWLKNEDNNSESTLSLNLSKLISFFFSDEKNENISLYRSKPFTLKALKKNENTAQ